MNLNKQFTAQKWFKDSRGNVVIWQRPNIPLWGWIVTRLSDRLVHDTHVSNGLHYLGVTLLFTWSYLELTSGVNYFRRTLGLVVLAFTIISLFT